MKTQGECSATVGVFTNRAGIEAPITANTMLASVVKARCLPFPGKISTTLKDPKNEAGFFSTEQITVFSGTKTSS